MLFNLITNLYDAIDLFVSAGPRNYPAPAPEHTYCRTNNATLITFAPLFRSVSTPP